MRTASALWLPAIAPWLLLLLSGISAAQPADPLIMPEGLRQVSERVYVIPDNFVPLVPNVGIVVGASASLVIDTGLGPRNGEIIRQVLERLSSNQTVYVVATHYHPEHSLGIAGLGADALFVAAAAQRQEMDAGAGIRDLFARRSPLTAELLRDVAYPTPDILFEGGIELDLGGLSARIFQSGPLHTRGDTLVFIEEEGVLFSGDVLMSGVFPSLDRDNGSVTGWIEYLDYLESLEAEVIVGAHGAVGDGSMVDNWRLLFAALTAETRVLKNGGVSESDAAARLTSEFPAKYPAWRSDARRMGAAVHVLYRELD